MKLISRILILSLLLLVFNFSSAVASTQYSFLRLSARDGLVNNQVTCLFEDSKGFIWIGTTSGLSRFDGNHFVNFSHDRNDSTTIGDNYITSIQEDKEGMLWIETRWEMSVYNPLTNHFRNDVREYLQPKGILEQIERVYIDQNKAIWYRSASRGKYFFLDTVAHQLVDPFQTDNKNGFQQQLIHKDGKYYLLYVNGLIETYDDKSHRLIRSHDALLEQYAEEENEPNLYVDKDGDFYVYGNNIGINYFNSKTQKWEYITMDHPTMKLSSNIIRRIVQDDKGLIWVGTDHGGIDILNKYSHEIQTLSYQKDNPTSISQNTITDIFIDSNNLIWVGTFKNGISYYHESIFKFAHYHSSSHQDNGLPYNDVNCFAEDAQGNLWIGTNGGGLVYFDRKNNTYKSYTHDPGNSNSISNNVVVGLFIDTEGILWIGTYTGGLNSFDGKNFKTYKVKKGSHNSLTSNNIWDIVEDDQQRLWIATLGGGVNIFDKKTNRFEEVTNLGNVQLPSAFVSQICKMNTGNLVFGTALGVVFYDMKEKRYRYHPNAIKDSPISISNNNVNDVFEDSRGWIWIATREGLTMFDPYNDYIKTFDREDGLPTGIINCILEDEFQAIWVSKSSGVSQIIPKAIASASEYEFMITNYTEDDGLQGQEFNVNASLRTSDDDLIFGGPNGFNLFKPKNMKYNKILPNVVFTELQVFNKPVKVGEKINGKVLLTKSITETEHITLKHSMNVFSIEFAGLSYFNPNKVKFKYMLEGFDQGWNETSSANSKVTYTNLNGGDYEFKVMACNNDGFWNETPSTIKLTVLPPFYASNLAFVIYFIFISGILIYIRYSMLKKERMKLQMENDRILAQKHHEMDEMKLRFLTNVSHEFRTPLTLILTPLEKLLKMDKAPSERNLLETIQRNTNELLNLVNQLLDFRKLDLHGLRFNPSYGDIVNFLSGVCNNFTDSFQKSGVQFSFNSNINQFFFRFDHEKLNKVMMNLISNALKFTPKGGEVLVTIDRINTNENKQGEIQIRVKDTGVGIEKSDHEKIFERFYQSSNSSALGYSGSGIGLNLVKEMIELHNGSIKVESIPNKGAEFIVSIPVPEEQITEEKEVKVETQSQGPIEKPAKEKKVQGKPIVLLIEDNFDFRSFMRETLMDTYEVHEAADGVEGYELVFKLVPDLIISDVMMPRMDGLEMCKKLKNDARTSHIPLILLTARTADEDKIKGLEIGADDYITKPFNMDLLLLRIQNLVEKQLKVQDHFQKNIDISPSVVEITSLDEKLIKKAISCVEKNISEARFSVEDLSRELGMSRVYLYKKLMAITGKSPVEFIRIIRLKRGAQLLEKSQLTVAEIAYEVGFNSPRYFSKYFKEEYGMLPTAYIKEKTNK
nr:two-component regulator propeller domain-containing protein [uncultured Carboxylicivirga sp.]